MKKGRPDEAWSCSLIGKLTSQMSRKIKQHYKDSGLGTNSNRDVESIRNAIMLLCRKYDVVSAVPAFHPYAKGNKAYFITNNARTADLEYGIKQFCKYSIEIAQKTNGWSGCLLRT